jgi:hypothetical protein
LFAELAGTTRLMAELMYGAGLRFAPERSGTGSRRQSSDHEGYCLLIEVLDRSRQML